jgi:hypothetical protein
MALGLLISFLARHLTQYACMIPPSFKLFAINNKLLLGSCQVSRTFKPERLAHKMIFFVSKIYLAVTKVPSPTSSQYKCIRAYAIIFIVNPVRRMKGQQDEKDGVC